MRRRSIFTYPKSEGEVTNLPTALNPTYSGLNLNLVTAGTGTGEMMYSLDNYAFSSTIPQALNAGEYTVYYYSRASTHYKRSPVGSLLCSIELATGSVSVSPTANSLTYSGSPQELVTGGSGTGTIFYSIDGENFSSTIPTETDVDTYTVYYYAEESSNYTASSVSTLNVTINKVTPTVVAPTAKVLTYNGSSLVLANAGSTNFGTLLYSLDNINYSTTVPSAIDANITYNVYYKVVGNSNVNNVAATYVECAIAEKRVTSPTITLDVTNYTYSGSECKPTPTVKDGSTVIPSSEYSVTYSNNINVGTATVTISDIVNGNYYIEGSVTFTISKANASYTAPTAKSLTYSGGAQALLNAGSTSHGTIQYSSNNSSWSTTIPTGTTATTYTSYWRLVGDSNHNDVASTSISTTINKASGSVSTAPTAKSLSYTGSALSLVNAGSGTGTMYYSLNSSSGFSTSIPTATTTGTYTVYYYAAVSTNYNQSSTGNVSVTISKANPTYTAPTAKTGLTYNGSSQYLYNAGSNTTAGSFSYSNGTRVNAGSQTVSWSFTPTDTTNYNSKSGSFSGSIAQATGSASVSGLTVTYNGNALNMVSVSSNTGTMHYRVGTSGSWTTTIPTRTNYGSDTIYFYMDASTNYTARGSSSSPWSYVTGTVNKANLSAPTATGATVTYGSTATASASGGGGVGSIEWSNGNSRSATGSQTTKARWSGGTNYNASAWSNEVTLTVNKASGATGVSTSAMSITYSTTTATRSVSGNTGTVTVSSSNTGIATVSISGSTITVTRKGYGSATITCSAAASTNYNAASSTFSVSCNRAARSGAVSCNNVTYGSTVTASVSGNTETGSITWSITNGTGKATINSSGVVTPTLAGTVTINASVAATTNYAAYTATSKTITISKATPTVSITGTSGLTFTVIGRTLATSVTKTGDGTITYSSSNTSIATISSSGTITGIAAGSCTITATTSATTNWNSASGSFTLTVEAYAAYYANGTIKLIANADTSAIGIIFGVNSSTVYGIYKGSGSVIFHTYAVNLYSISPSTTDGQTNTSNLVSRYSNLTIIQHLLNCRKQSGLSLYIPATEELKSFILLNPNLILISNKIGGGWSALWGSNAGVWISTMPNSAQATYAYTLDLQQLKTATAVQTVSKMVLYFFKP